MKKFLFLAALVITGCGNPSIPRSKVIELQKACLQRGGIAKLITDNRDTRITGVYCDIDDKDMLAQRDGGRVCGSLVGDPDIDDSDGEGKP